jgi:hypothetical protein
VNRRKPQSAYAMTRAIGLVLITSLTDTTAVERCGRIKKTDGKPCRNPVRSKGMACHDHGGPGAPTSGTRRSAGAPTRASAPRVSAIPPSAYSSPSQPRPAPPTYKPQPPSPPPPSRSEQERKRIEKTAEFCADVISSSWQEAVTDQIAQYAPTTWGRLSRSSRRRNCKVLARAARWILEKKEQIHTAIGKMFGWAIGRLGAGDAVRAFTEELVSNIPLPTDPKMIAVARGLQVTGILLCVMDDRELTKCDCFIDLALAETMERVKQILVAAMSDWVNLARFRPQTVQAAR